MALEFLELLLSTKTSFRKTELPSETECEGLSCSGHGKRNEENRYTCQLTDWGIHDLPSPS